MPELYLKNDSPVNKKDILVFRIEDQARVVFLYPYDPRFIRACEAMKLRGLLAFGPNPIKRDEQYKGWFADLEVLDDASYADYAMLVRDFYTGDVRQKFDALFPDVKVDKIKASVHNPNEFMAALQPEVDRLIDKYKHTTSPLEFYGSKHQAEGVALFLSSMTNKFSKGFICADEPGLGKSRVAAVAAVEGGFKNILIVAPKTVKEATWPREIKTVDPKATIFLADHKKYQSRARWTVIHWDALRLLGEDFFANAGTFDLLIADEFHKVANEKSGRSQAFKAIADQIPHVWGLTGTPVTKRPKNVVNLLRLLKHPMANTGDKVWKFLNRYCGGLDWTGHYNFDGAKNLEELHEHLRDVFIRREKSQTNLPDKIRVIKKIELTAPQRKAYDDAWPDYCAQPEVIEKQKNVNYPFAVVEQGVLKKSMAAAKVPHIIEWAEELLDAGEKVVIFTDFTDVFDAYMKHFSKVAVGINGATPGDRRGEIVRRFQEDPGVKVFVGNIKAAGEGITLTAASYLAFNDITWLPGDQIQAENRIHRGGARKTCMIYFFLGEDTVDIKGFKDFVEHKNIVETIVNRRQEDGSIKDGATWAGDTDNLGLEKKAPKEKKAVPKPGAMMAWKKFSLKPR